jgi:2-C-methyl-D-erythritol 4-phosphate cytidylyltransferase
VASVVLVVSEARRAWAERFVRREGFRKVRRVAAGGAERADSVRAGLGAIPPGNSVVLIHDAARALVPRAVIERVINAARRTGAALAARRVPDTLKRGRARGGRFVVQRTLPRADLWLAQTPQGFRSDVLARVAPRLVSSLTDDVQAAERRGIPVEIVEGSALNFKVTIPEDLEMCRMLLKGVAA